DDGSLLAYPLATQFRDNLDYDGYTAFARIGSSGATASFSTGTVGAYADGTLRADGSLVTVGTTMERVASDGTLIWSVINPLGVDFGSVVQMSGDALLLAVPLGSQLKLRLLTLDNGAVSQSLDLAITPSNNCYRVAMVGGANGSAFIGDPCVSPSIIKVLESPLRLDPNWQPTPAITYVRNIHFDGGSLYAAVQSEGRAVLRKFDPTTGATLWTYPEIGSEFGVTGLFADLEGVLVVRAVDATNASAIQRIDPATGALLWSYAPTRNVAAVTAAGNNFVIGGTVGSTAELDQARGYLEGINLATGAFKWQATLTAPQGGGSTLSGLAIQGSQAIAIGAGCPTTVYGRASCDATLWRNGLAKGASAEAAAVKLRSGNVGAAFVEPPPAQPIAATLEMGSAGPQLHIRKLALSNGSTTLDIVTPVQMTFPWLLPEFARVIQSGDGNFVVLLTIRRRTGQEPDAVVTKISGTSGEVLWRRSLFNLSLDRKDMDIVSVSSDSAGSVFFNVAYENQSAEQTESIKKLASTTGDVVWEVPVQRQQNTPLFAGVVQMIGDDVLDYSYPSLPGGAGWQRRRGSDGSVVWSSTSLPVFPNVVSNIAIYGTSITGNTLTLARIDPLTGATLCSG
ncbi:MAG: PQQ-binding-like beta-propeller repeat protein, partial [Dokdonella sp.]